MFAKKVRKISLHILRSLHVVNGSVPNASTVSYSFCVAACYETFYTAVDILNTNVCSFLVFFSLFIFFPFVLGLMLTVFNLQ